jgi:hypothetical protein
LSFFEVLFNEANLTAFQSAISGHFVQNKKTRDEGIQFTWESFLHVTEVHISLVNYKNPYSGYLGLHTNDQKNTTFAIFNALDFFGLVKEFETDI